MKSITLTGIISLFLLIFAVSPASALTVPVNSTNLDHTLIVSNLLGASVQFVLNDGIPVPVVAVDGTARYLPLVSGTLEIIAISNGSVLSGYSVKIVETGGVTSTPADRISSSNGGSTGGGGVISGEPFANIAKSETRDGSLYAGKPVAFTFNSSELAIRQILITGKENENYVTVRVESLKNTSRLVSRPAPGTVYTNTNVWVNSKRISAVTLKFRVTNAWITGSNVQKETIKLLRWSDNDWKSLNTAVLTRDDTYTYFEAQSAGLSSFAVSAVKEGQVPVETTLPSTTVTTPAINASTPGKKPTPGFGMLVTVLVVSAIYMLRRRDG